MRRGKMFYLHRKNSLIYSALSLFIILLSISSCATAPPMRASEDWFALLPSHSGIYIYLDKNRTAAMVENVLKSMDLFDNDIKFILSKTTKIYGAVDFSGDSEPVLSILTLGSYPSSLIGLRLSMNREWKRRKSIRPYFVSGSNKMEISLPGNNVILISQGKIEEMLKNYQSPPVFKMPMEVKNDLHSSDFLVFFPLFSEGTALNNNLSSMKTTVNELWLTGRRDGEMFKLNGVFGLSSEKQAKLFAVVFKFIITAWLRQEKVQNIGKLLKSVVVKADGNFVRISGLKLPEKKITSLLTGMVKKGKSK
ncbi:MAG: hypothetical protein GXP33_14820 [Spirochaetes bacterium]|nr:hypothetical protein [Spirochaetota bacterium]